MNRRCDISEIVEAYRRLDSVSKELNEKFASSGIEFKVKIDMAPIVGGSSQRGIRYRLLMKLMAYMDVERVVLSKFNGDDNYFGLSRKKTAVEILRLGFNLPMPEELIQYIVGDDLNSSIGALVKDIKEGEVKTLRPITMSQSSSGKSAEIKKAKPALSSLKSKLLSPAGIMVAEALVEFAKAGIEFPRLIC